ncbi:hypothetical protein [Bacillus horti]|uniref:DUF3298 domain-containing protein n=1 Tax=Caldalkalibacillus horti TaxID=77523 RepID=A0ABT9VWU3_9BACI|nr:hypothetical protein [Bacillus horti]MDQ0165075.1 hypothetical protein [Bacillus horti]
MKQDNFKSNYKRVMDQMKADDKMKQRIQAKIEENKQEKRKSNKGKIIAASLLVAAGIGLAAPSVWNQVNQPVPTQIEVADGVTIPKMEIPDTDGPMLNMIPLVVYQGNVYTQSESMLSPADALELRGEKLGQTTGGIDEWSSEDDYIELASNIGETEIYAVNGYDTDFRVMSYIEIDGQIYADIYENMNGMTITNGEDLLGKLKLEGRISSAQWESFDSWNNGKEELNTLSTDGALQSFIQELHEARPLAAEPLVEQGIYEDESRKTIHLTLEDNTHVQLVLFPNQLVRYGNVPVFLEVDEEAFQALWDRMSE